MAKRIETPVKDVENGAFQNIVRASSALDALAGASASGLRLVDVVRLTGLAKTVAHRLLSGLVANGLAEYDDESSRYFLGDRVFGWASAASQRFDVAVRVKPYLARLAKQTDDTAYFTLRRRDHAVCYGRAEGGFPIKTLTLNVGDRRPLGVGSGSLALLAFIPDEDEIADIVAHNATAYSAAGISVNSIRKMIDAARRTGYAMVEGHVMKDMSAIGVPIRDPAGVPVAALSIAAITSRLSAPRRQEVVAALQQEAARCQSELAPLFARAAGS